MRTYCAWRRAAAAGVTAAAVAISASPAGAQEPPYGLDSRTTIQGLNFPDLPPATGAVKLERAFPNVKIGGGLTYLATAPGDDSQIYVTTKNGVIWVFPNDDSIPDSSKKKFLDLSANTLTDGEQGLIGFAFDAGFASNQTFYVYYTPNTGAHRSRLSRFQVGANNKLTLLSEKVLLELAQDSNFHKAGCTQIGPDGKLYLTTGDGSNGGDPGHRAQNLGLLYGKVLRMNLDGSVPADNPFVGTAGANGLIWAYGLRNPWRCSFDRATGELWVGDVGQEKVEEVDIIRKGGNYGWSVYEGNLPYNNAGNLPYSSFDPPLLMYPHDGSGLVSGTSVTGGYVYRGNKLGALVGQYVFGDFTGGNVYALTRSGNQVTQVRIVGSVPQITSLGTNNAGDIYVLTYYGSMYKVVPEAPGSSNFPTRLSQTGLFTDLAHLTPTPGLIEYEINAPFWSDGAIKRRWIGLPGNSTINFSVQDAWSWPARTVVVKHFEMAMADGTTRRLETRVLINQQPGWRGYTYRWNAAGSDADLIDGTQTVELDVMDPSSPTGQRHQTYEFPSRGACLTCHNAAKGEVLGLRTAQVNRAHTYANGVTDNQLRSFNHIGLFNYDIGAPALYYAMPDPAGTLGPAARARTYLDVNCSQCHLPGGPTAVDMDFRVYTPLAQTSTVDVAPTAGDLGIADARRIAPGSKDKSIVWQRMDRPDYRMPPIASHVIDQAAVSLIGQWIDAGAADSPDQARLQPMAGGDFSGVRGGGKDRLAWNFPRAQSCLLNRTDASNARSGGKNIGTFPGTFQYEQAGSLVKTTYRLDCSNPYGLNSRSVVLQ